MFMAQTSITHSAPTVIAYDYDVKKFIEFLHSRGIKTIANVKPQHVTDYLATCKAAGKSEASLRRYYMAIKSYCEFLYENDLVAKSITCKLKSPRVMEIMAKVPTQAEMEKMLELPSTGASLEAVRDRAILELLYSSGLRSAELIGLQLDDVNGSNVRVSCGKGGKTRVVPMTEQAQYWVERYVRTLRGIEPGYLFMTHIRPKLNPSFLERLVKHYAVLAGIPYVTPHTLRHACATHLLEQGADLRMIRDVLGHASVASTQRYTQVSSVQMNEMFHKFHPRKTPVGV